jgi:hypothetical protein
MMARILPYPFIVIKSPETFSLYKVVAELVKTIIDRLSK